VDPPRLFKLSPSTDRALTLPRPRFRGISHRWASFLAVPAGIWLTLATPAGSGRLAVGVFAACIWVMFTVSALVHWRTWSPHTTEVLFRMDHSAIFLAIAGTATPLAVLGLEGWARTAILAWVWGTATIGIVLEWLPFARPKGWANTVYLSMSWGAVLFVPMLWRSAGPDTVILMLAGGLLYTVGAVIVGIRRPDPNPEVFGYHEIWHLLVVAAAAIHYVMVGATLVPLASA
jgi:hemolysin III